jgi:hypothetical protein
MVARHFIFKMSESLPGYLTKLEFKSIDIHVIVKINSKKKTASKLEEK